MEKIYQDIRKRGEMNDFYSYLLREFNSEYIKSLIDYFNIDKKLIENGMYFIKYSKVIIGELPENIEEIRNVDALATYIFLCVISSFDNIQAIDISTTGIDDELVYKIVSIFKRIAYMFGLRIRENEKLHFLVYWDKIHSYEYSLKDCGVSRFQTLLKYGPDECEEKYMRYLR